MKVKQYIRILIGLFFIVSAILKFISIDEFEIYLYSFGFLDFISCSLLSRLLIIAEIAMGLFFILKIFYKYTWSLILSCYIAFTIFLCYTAIFRNDSNCHCLGDLIELNPIESIIKNIIIISLLFSIRGEKSIRYKYNKLIVTASILSPILAVCIIIPSDNLYNLFYANPSNINIEVLNNSIKDTILLNRVPFVENLEDLESNIFESEKVSIADINNQTLLLGVLSSGCKYCSLAMKKLNLIFENNNLDKKKFIVLIWSDTESLKEFIKETNAYGYEYRLVSAVTAINLCYGEFPSFAMMKNGEIISTINYTSINEKEIVEFLE